MTIDQQFIEYIIKSLVGDPDAVHVERTVDEKGVLLTLTVAPDDLGRVIGKRGTTAQSLRTLLRALGTKNDARYNLKIVDLNRPDEPVRPAEPQTDDTSGADDGSTYDTSDATAAAEPVDMPEETPAEALAEETVEEPAPDPTPVEEAPVEDSTPVTAEDDHSDVVSKTRAELEELDDLDI